MEQLMWFIKNLSMYEDYVMIFVENKISIYN